MESARVRCLHTSCGVSEIERVRYAHSFSDTKQRVCKHRAKHFPCLLNFTSNKLPIEKQIELPSSVLSLRKDVPTIAPMKMITAMTTTPMILTLVLRSTGIFMRATLGKVQESQHKS